MILYKLLLVGQKGTVVKIIQLWALVLRVVIPSDGKGEKICCVLTNSEDWTGHSCLRKASLTLRWGLSLAFYWELIEIVILCFEQQTCDGICCVLKQTHPIVLHVLHPGHLGTDKLIPSRRDTLVSNSFIRPVMQIRLSFSVLSPLELKCTSPFGFCTSGFVGSLKLFRNSAYLSIPIYQVSFLVIKLREHLLKF